MARRKSLIKLKREPGVPVRRTNYKYSVCIEDLVDLQEMIQWSNHFGALPHECKIENEGGYSYGEGYSPYLVYRGDEPEEEWQRRVDRYHREKAAYDRWYAANKETVEEEIHLRAQEKAAKIARDKEKKRVELEKQRARIEKDLARLR